MAPLVLIGVTARVEPVGLEEIVEAIALRTGSFPAAASAFAAVTAVYPFEPTPTAAEKLLSE